MKLDSLFRIKKGKKPPELFNARTETSIPFIKIEGIRDSAQIQYCEDSPTLVKCDRNDVLMVWDGAYCGLTSFGLEGAIGSTIARLRPKSRDVFGPYAGSFLRSKFQEIQKNATGAAIPHINGVYLRNLDIPLPPLDQQTRIAAVMEKADTLRRQREESLPITETLLQSVFITMFGDPMSNPKHWKTLPLEELCDKIIDCPHSTPVYADTVTGFYCVRSSDIQNGKLDLASTRHVTESIFRERIARHEPKAGEVIYTREGGRLGFAAQVPHGRRICLGQRMMLFSARENVATNAFLANLLNSQSFRRKVLNLVGGGAAPRVNIKDLKVVAVYQPPFELQQRFETIAERLSAQHELLVTSQTHTQRLFESLQQRAFRGELDLSRVILDAESGTSSQTLMPDSAVLQENLTQPTKFTASPEIESEMLSLEAKLSGDQSEFIPWNEDYFKYRTLTNRRLSLPFTFDSIWESVQREMPEADYDSVRDTIFRYVESGCLKQMFCRKRKAIIFLPTRL